MRENWEEGDWRSEPQALHSHRVAAAWPEARIPPGAIGGNESTAFAVLSGFISSNVSLISRHIRLVSLRRTFSKLSPVGHGGPGIRKGPR